MRTIFRPHLLALLALFATLWPAAAQKLASVNPASGAFGVSPNTPVIFTFDTDMQEQQEITWSSIVGASFTPLSGISYQWTGPRTLVATRSGGFPASATIVWELEPEGFADEFGFPLDTESELSGGFLTRSGGGGGGETGVGSAELGVFKVANFEQLSPADPVLATNLTYLFGADVSSPETRGLTNVVLTIPGGATTNLLNFAFEPTEFFLTEFTNSLTGLNARFPAGSYGFALQAPGSNQNVSVTLPATAFPAAPKIANFAAGQTIDPAADFTLQFNAGGVATEHVEISIWDKDGSDEVYNSPDLLEPGHLTGTATSVVLPAGTFTEGRTYEVQIGRWIVSTNVASGNAIAAGIGSTTLSVLKTTGGEPVTIRLENPAYGQGIFQARATFAANRLYHFEKSTNAVDWLPVAQVFAVEPAHIFIDPQATNSHAIYRVRTD